MVTEKKYLIKKSDICRGSCWCIPVLHKRRRSIRKTANGFAVSRALISSIIRKVSHAVMTFLGPQLIKLPKTEMEVKQAVKKFLETNGFPHSIGAIDGIHIEITEQTK